MDGAAIRFRHGRKAARPALRGALAGVLLCLGACTKPYLLYQEPIAELESARARAAPVAVMISPDPPVWEDVRPAKGIWGGIKRGAVVGAALPIAIGFVSPVPGGTLMGAMVAPFTAIAGGAYGAFRALRPEQVEAVDDALVAATDRLATQQLKERLRDRVIERGARLTGATFQAVPWQPLESPDPLPQTQTPAASILRLEVTRIGLAGYFRLDPPSSAFVTLRATLSAADDGQLLTKARVACHSEPARFLSWGEDDGRMYEDAVVACVEPLADKVLDDLFLVWPDGGNGR